MTRGGQDTLSGAVLLLGSLALLLALPGQIEAQHGPDLTSAFIPRLMIIGIAGLSLILLAQGILTLRREDAAPEKLSAKERLRGIAFVIGVAVVIAIQTSLLTRFGYIGSSALAAGALALLYGHRRWWQILLLMIAAPPIILIFFRYTMLVLLPGGTWFE